MDFASSAYPDWLNTDDFPSWRNPDHDFSPKFLKLKTDTTRTNSKRVPIISYVMVNDDHPRSFMANGRVVCIKDTTCYIQHNSKHPISDDVVIDVMRRLLDQLAP